MDIYVKRFQEPEDGTDYLLFYDPQGNRGLLQSKSMLFGSDIFEARQFRTPTEEQRKWFYDGAIVKDILGVEFESMYQKASGTRGVFRSLGDIREEEFPSLLAIVRELSSPQ